MNWAYKLFWTSVLAASVSLMMAGCGQKKDNDLGVRGNVVSDGQSVHSQSTINGIETSVGITNITLMNNGMNYAYNNNPYGYNQMSINGGANIPVTFQIVVNGQTKTVNTYSQGLNGFQSQDILAGTTLNYATRCGDWACNTFYMSVTVGQGTGGQVKQIGLMKIMGENKIVAVFEHTVMANAVLSIDLMVQQLSSIYLSK